jgi:hypothetical protein
MLALEREEADQAVKLLEEGLQFAKSTPVRIRARVLAALARALSTRRASGDIERGRKAFQDCLSLLDQMGDTRKAKQVRAELSSLGWDFFTA